MSSLITKTITVQGRRTSVKMEPELWGALDMIANKKNVTHDQIYDYVAQNPPQQAASATYTSQLRTFIIISLKQMIAPARGDGGKAS